MAAVVLVRQWGSAWGIVVYVLWWINTAMGHGGWIGYVDPLRLCESSAAGPRGSRTRGTYYCH